MSTTEGLTDGLAQYAASPARKRWWFDELVTGRGAARALPLELRSVLAMVTVSHAVELVTAEEAEVSARAREARRVWRASNNAVVGVAFARLGVRIFLAAILVPVLLITVWLLGGIADIFDRTSFIESVGEEWRIVVIVSSLVTGLLFAFVIDLALGAPKSDDMFDRVFVAFWIGIVLSGVAYFANLTSLATWYVLPAAIVIAYVIAAVRTGSRAAIRRGEQFTFSQLWKR